MFREEIGRGQSPECGHRQTSTVQRKSLFREKTGGTPVRFTKVPPSSKDGPEGRAAANRIRDARVVQQRVIEHVKVLRPELQRARFAK